MARYAIILAGGSGVRLWPLSRESMPKQLIPVQQGKSLLEAAFERLEGVVPPEHRWVCGGARYEDVVRTRLPNLGRYLGEPEGRDTLAAIGLSCALVRKEDPEATVAILTSDHVIEPVDDFRTALDFAFATAESSMQPLVTFGIAPTFAATAYGYLELGEPLMPGKEVRRVKRFCEKPNLSTAESFVAEGPARYLWNSGMFVFRASRLLELLARYEPATADIIANIASTASPDARAALLRERYPQIPKKSVDYGIMEPASKDPEVTIACVPLTLQWRDIGSWNAYATLGTPDAAGNTAILARGGSVEPSALFVESSGTLAVSTDPDHLIALLGCEDLVVVHTADTTLICPKTRAEELKKLHPLAVARGKG